MIVHNPQSIDLCILMPCYNDFEGLVQSINSIVYHAEKFIVLVVDDGSAEPLVAESIRQNIPRLIHLKIIRLQNNSGITNALNTGLEFIYANFSTRFIARLDCGDICSPGRFHAQVSFLENNPGIHLVGSWCYFKDAESGAAYKYITPTTHKLIKRSMHFRNVFIHPTVMWRFSARRTLKYPEQYPYAEDYGLFYDMISKKKSAIMNEFLVTCKINRKGLSIRNRSTQLKSRLKVISDYSRNRFFFLMGSLKLRVLLIVPYPLIFLAKKKLYKA